MKVVIKPNLLRYIVPSFIGLIFFILVLVFLLIFFRAVPELDAYSQLILFIFSIVIILVIINYILSIFRLKNTQYIISPSSIEFSEEFIRNRYTSIPAHQITNVDSFVSFILDKLFKTGSMQVYTSGSSGSDLTLNYISNVEHVYETIESYLEYSKEEEKEIKQNSSNLDSNTNGVIDSISTPLKNSKEVLLQVKPNSTIATILTLLQVFGVLFIFILPLFFSAFIFMISLFLGSTSTSLAVMYTLITIIIPVGLLIGIGFIIKRRFSKITYNFYADRIEYFDGFFNVIKHTIPYERITNSNSYQGIIDRIVGASTITIETAGSHSSNITIRYVTDGESINSRILEILKQRGEN